MIRRVLLIFCATKSTSQNLLYNSGKNYFSQGYKSYEMRRKILFFSPGIDTVQIENCNLHLHSPSAKGS
jgi:hypothetical protein